MNKKFYIYRPIVSAARTTTGSQLLNSLPGSWDTITGYLIVTAASGTNPTLDVVYQTTPDGGTTWFTVTSFTQATGTTTQRLALTAPIGVDGRILYTIGGTDTPTFTFSLDLECKNSG